MQYFEKEQDTNPDATKWIALCANGNKDAERFLLDFYSFYQMFDDLIDRDKEVSHDEALSTTIDFIGNISFNPFYQQWKQLLFGLLVSAAEREVSGNELSRDEKTKIQGDVVRCGCTELFLTVAFLCGGWDHMRKLKAIRNFD
jgi:hypothetical protein